MDFDPNKFRELLNIDLSDFSDCPAAVSLQKSILKKYVTPGVSFRDAAFSSFLERNNAFFTKNVLPVHRSRLLNTWKSILHRIFHSGEDQTNVLTLSQCHANGIPGPGSSHLVKHTDFYRKMFCSDLSSTSDSLYRFYVSGLSERWYAAEEFRLRNHSVLVTKGSRLESVPKDSTKDRTICIEPSLNMYFQLGAKHVLEGLLRRFYNIDVSTQPDINKSLARAGSVSNGLATIDLKDASDSIHTDLVQFLLPTHAYRTLDFVRSQECLVDGTWVKFSMFSTMGNGFTFPLMTLLFCSLLEAFCVHKDIDKFQNGVNFGVFGDDIILPSEHAGEFMNLLADVGFTPNLDKTFSTGPFRESCGGDFYLGHDVRGVYIKRVQNEADIYAVFNRLCAWSCKHGIPLYNTLVYLKGLARFRAVPIYENIDSGFRITSTYIRNRRNKQGAYYYSKLAPRSSRYTLTAANLENPHGAFISALGGYVSGNKVSVRSKRAVYRVVKMISPCWDYSTDPVLNVRDYDLALQGVITL